MSPRPPAPTLALAALVAALAGCPAPAAQPTEQRVSIRPSTPPIERSPAQAWLATSPKPRPSAFRLPPSPGSPPEPDVVAASPSAPPCAGPGAVYTLEVDGTITRPTGAATGPDGHLWISLYDAHAVVELAPVEGCGWREVRRVGGTSAALNDPRGLAFDVEGRWLYVADFANHRIRRIDTSEKELALEPFAGSGIGGYRDGEPSQAWFHHPAGVAVDRAGNVYVADSYNHKIRKISPADARVTTIAGGTQGDAIGEFDRPAGVAVQIERVVGSPPPADVPGAIGPSTSFVPTLWVADTLNHRVVRLSPPGPSPSPSAGGGTSGGGAQNGGSTSVFGPGAGSDWVFTVIAGKAGEKALVDGPPADSRLADPAVVLFDAGALWVADTGNHAVRRIGSPLAASPVITTFAGGGQGRPDGPDGPLLEASFRFPQGLARGPRGELFIADTDDDRVRLARGNQEAP